VETATKMLFDSKSKSIAYGYSELINTNSIISIPVMTKASRFETEIELFSPSDSSSGTFIFTSQSYKSYYAVQLQGSKKGIEKAVLQQCAVKDTTLPPSAKNNFTITELASKPVSLKWGNPVKITITAKKKKLKADINGTEIDFTLDSALPEGSVGFSHTNNLMKIRSIKVLSDNTVIFEDDFSQDRIKKMVYKAEKVDKASK